MEIKVDSIELHENYGFILNGTQKMCVHGNDHTSPINCCGTWCPLFHYEEIPERKVFQFTFKARKQITLCQDRVYYTPKPLEDSNENVNN